jgi:hypothetical protein
LNFPDESVVTRLWRGASERLRLRSSFVNFCGCERRNY